MTRNPPIDLLHHIPEDRRAEWKESWKRAGWLTSPISAALERHREYLVRDLVYGEEEDHDQLRADIRALDKLKELLP